MIDLPTLQQYLNFHYSVTIDLFGAEISSNAATFYATGLKGRFEETKRTDDHKLHGSEYPYMEVVGGQIVTKHAPALNALNERLRDDWVTDVQSADQPLEQDSGESRHRLPLHAAAQGLQSPHRHCSPNIMSARTAKS